VDADLDTLATALYVTTDDLLKTAPHLAPWRPAVGIAPKLSDAELVTLAVMQALLGFPSEARWLRYARAHLGHLFPTCPSSPATTSACAPPPRCSSSSSGRWPATRGFGPTTCGWPTPPRWSAAAPPKPSTAPSWPGGPSTAIAPATRATLGLRLHLICTLHGLPVGFALTGAKADEREVLLGILAADPALLAARPGQTLIADKHYFGGVFQAALAAQRVRLLRPARKGEPERAGAHLFKPLRQVIESINDTFKGQLDLERHGGHTPAGVIVRVLQRILALTAAIWHNDHTGQPTPRSSLPTTTNTPWNKSSSSARWDLSGGPPARAVPTGNLDQTTSARVADPRRRV
jgi:hypothetical protein